MSVCMVIILTRVNLPLQWSPIDPHLTRVQSPKIHMDPEKCIKVIS